MDDLQVAAVIDEACTRRKPYPRHHARYVARKWQARGRPVWAWGCPFATDEHWHVGDVRPLAWLERLAAAVLARKAA